MLSAITIIAADGEIDEAEMSDLAKIVRVDRKAVETAVQVMKTNQFPGVIDLIANCLDEKQKLTTLAILFDLAMAYGMLAGNEQKILQMYVDKFGIAEEILRPIIDTIAIKNNFALFYMKRVLNFFSYGSPGNEPGPEKTIAAGIRLERSQAFNSNDILYRSRLLFSHRTGEKFQEG